MNKSIKNLYYVFVCFLLIFIDYLIKLKVKTNMNVGESKIVVNNFFKITYIQNRGAAFGLFQDKKYFFVIIGIFAVCIMIYMFTKSKDLLSKLSIVLIISGAIGNIIDRLLYGFVVDMFDFFVIWSYIFNFADICVVIGVFFLLITIMKDERKNIH